jgi:hypothetical protein
MSLISAIFGVFRKGTSTFSEFENHVLQAVMHELAPQAAARMASRIRSVNLVQRLDGGREVNCYCMRGGRATINESERLVDQDGEIELARVKIEGPAGTANKATLWLVGGQFFSIEFDEPTEHAQETAATGIQVEVLCESVMVRDS